VNSPNGVQRELAVRLVVDPPHRMETIDGLESR
jgi:hypothetical protein